MLTNLAFAASYALILLTAASAAYAAWHRRQTSQFDILAFVALLVAGQFQHPLGPVGFALPLAVGYVLLRLVQHFRDLPSFLVQGALALVPVGILAFAIWPQPGKESSSSRTGSPKSFKWPRATPCCEMARA